MDQSRADVPGLFFFDLVGEKRKREEGEEEEEGSATKVARLDVETAQSAAVVAVLPEAASLPRVVLPVPNRRRRFRVYGAVRIPQNVGLGPERQVAHDRSLAAMNFVSTTDDIRLALFADGSFHTKHTPAGYGIVFRKCLPTDVYNGRRVEMAWRLENTQCLDSMLVEGTALLQAVEVAIEEVEKLGGSGLQRKVIRVSIFSDCMGLLENIDSGFVSSVRSTHHIAMGYLLREIAAASKRLRDNSAGFSVDFEICWAKGHSGLLPYHTIADKLAKRVRSADWPVSSTWVQGLGEVDYPACVFDRLQDRFAALAVTTDGRAQLPPQQFTVSVRIPSPSRNVAPSGTATDPIVID